MRHVNLDLHSFIAVMLLMIFPHLACAQDGASTADNRYAGSDACIECHEDYYASYLKNRHGYASDPRTPAARQGCESCHGPGAEHAESDGEKPIRSLKPDSAGSADEKSAVCLSCHTNGRQALWSGSEHQSRNLSWTSCHNIHKTIRTTWSGKTSGRPAPSAINPSERSGCGNRTIHCGKAKWNVPIATTATVRWRTNWWTHRPSMQNVLNAMHSCEGLFCGNIHR